MADRTLAELAIKTTALHIATIASAAHLISLQGQPWSKRKSSLWQLAWFIAVPTYPLALLLDRVYGIAKLLCSKSRPKVSLSYCFDAILGLHVEALKEDDNRPVPLLMVPHGELRKTSRQRDVRWYGRLFILLCALAQSAGTLLLCGRRLQHDELGEIDIRNAWTALGGAVVITMSIAIMLGNNRWERSLESTVPISQAATSTSTYRTPKRPSFIVRSVVTLTILNTWYFRFHIRDTLKRAINIGKGPPSYLTVDSYPFDTNSITDSEAARCPAVYIRPDPGGALMLPDFVWLAWPIMIYHAQQEHGNVVLLITFFHSLGFPIEEMVKGTFKKWKDPLADALYVV